jgi:hypothetical protein
MPMPSRGLAIAPASRSLYREDLVLDPASEPTMRSCEIAWLGRSHLEQEEQLLPLRKRTSRALRGVRHSRSNEEPVPRQEPGTIIHSCANVWQAEFADGLVFLTWAIQHILSVRWPSTVGHCTLLLVKNTKASRLPEPEKFSSPQYYATTSHG